MRFFTDNNINAEIEVDGNISWESIPFMIENGAIILVNGSSSIFNKQYSRKEAIERVRMML